MITNLSWRSSKTLSGMNMHEQAVNYLKLPWNHKVTKVSLLMSAKFDETFMKRGNISDIDCRGWFLDGISIVGIFSQLRPSRWFANVFAWAQRSADWSDSEAHVLWSFFKSTGPNYPMNWFALWHPLAMYTTTQWKITPHHHGLMEHFQSSNEHMLQQVHRAHRRLVR